MSVASIKVLSEQRERLDSIKKSMLTLPRSRGLSLATTALEKGRMYIGEMLFVLGKAYPYDKTKGATDASGIQDAVDTSVARPLLSDNEIVNLNTIRTEMQIEIDEFLVSIFHPVTGLSNTFKADLTKDKFIMDCNISEAYRGLKETRMWLGVRLGEIRDNSK